MALSVSSEFDYFAPQIIAGDIEEEYTVAIGTKQAIVGKQPLEFTIPAENNVYRDLNNTLLEVTCQVVQANGDVLAGTAVVAPVNLLLHSLFKSVEVKLNGNRVSDANNYYAERSYIETLLNYPEAVLNTRGVCEGWCNDDAVSMNAIVLADVAGNAASTPPVQAIKANNGFVKRNRWCATSKQMKFLGRLHSDLFHQPLDIPDSVKIDIKLDQNPDNKVLMAADTATFKVVILSARLLVRSKRLSTDLVLAHKALLDSKNCRIPFTRVVVTNDTVGTGGREVSRSNFYTGAMPNRITVFLTRSLNSNGTYSKNPFAFENFGLTNIWLKIGKTKYPQDDLSMDYEHGLYHDAYISTLASLGLDQGERALAITPEHWATSFNVYSFKLTPGPVNPNVLHTLHSQQVVIELQAKFSAPLTEPLTVFGYIELPALLEIDKLGNIIV